MAQRQDNNGGGFVKAQKPVRRDQERSTKNTHNRRAGFDSKRNQAGYTLIGLIQVLAFVFLIGLAMTLAYFALRGVIFLASL